MQYLRQIVLSAAAIVLCACGGEDATDKLTETLKFSFDQSPLLISMENDLPINASVIATAKGKTRYPIYLYLQIDEAVFANANVILISDRAASLDFYPRSELSPGVKTGENRLYVCKDEQCNDQHSGSPFKLPFQLTVKPGLQLSTTSVNFEAEAGQTPSAQQIQVTLPESVADYSIAAITPAEWLTIEKQHDHSIKLQVPVLRPADYQTSLLLTAGNRVRTINVRYKINPPIGGLKELAVTPASLPLALLETQKTSGVMTVQLPSWSNMLTLDTSATANWLTVERDHLQLKISANAAQLSRGNYQTSFRLLSDSQSTPVVVPVSLSVGSGVAINQNDYVTINENTTPEQLERSVSLAAADGVEFTWQATASNPAIVLLNSSGTQSEPLRYRVDKSLLHAGDLIEIPAGGIVFTFPGTAIPSLNMGVHISGTLPVITRVTPYVQVPGKTINLTAIGYDRTPHLPVAVEVIRVSDNQKMAVGQVTAVSGRGLDISLPPFAAGEYRIGMTNGLGLNTSNARFLVKNPIDSEYKAIETGGAIHQLIVDHERDAVLMLDTDFQSVLRYDELTGQMQKVFYGSGYQDMHLSPDGAQLLLLQTNYLSNWDPAQLTERSPRFAHNNIVYPTYGYTMSAITNMATIEFNNAFQRLGFCGIGTYSFSCGTGATLDWGWQSLWLQTSPDGDRLYSGVYLSRDEAMYYRDSNNFAWLPAPSGAVLKHNLATSDHNEVIVLDAKRVYNKDFSRFLGYIPLTLPEVGYSTALSPDGKRLYVTNHEEIGFNEWRTRVYVVDTDIDAITQDGQDLKVLGYFDVPDRPGCKLYSGSCWGGKMHSEMSRDGKKLYIASNMKLVITPIPQELTPVNKTGVGAKIKAIKLAYPAQ